MSVHYRQVMLAEQIRLEFIFHIGHTYSDLHARCPSHAVASKYINNTQPFMLITDVVRQYSRVIVFLPHEIADCL